MSSCAAAIPFGVAFAGEGVHRRCFGFLAWCVCSREGIRLLVRQPFSSVLLSLAKGCVTDALASWLDVYAWQGIAATWRCLPCGVRLCLVYIGRS
jgi:hypothetical protein